MQDDTPFVIGHRGACGHAPENTLPSIEKAAQLGLRWIEVDVKLSSDGVPLLMHDEDLGRITDGEGKVCDTGWSKLAKLDAGKWFGNGFAGTRLLRLEDAIGHFDALGLGVNLELKSCPGRERETAEVVCATIGALWPKSLPKPLISSFSFESVEVASRILPEIGRAIIADALPEDWQAQCQAVAAGAVHLWHEAIEPEGLGAVIDAGYKVRCFTVNQHARALSLRELGVSGIFCDFPERMTGLAQA